MANLAMVIALVGVLGVGAQWLAWRTGWPAIALMLLAGIVAGPVLGLIDPHAAFDKLLEPAVSIAVAIILFEGGLSLDLRELRQEKGTRAAVMRLFLIGIPVGWALGTVASYYVAGLVLPVAVLFAGILVVTGPTVVIPLLRQSNVVKRPRAILKWEAIVNDPFGALCAVLAYEYLRRSIAGATLLEVVVSMAGAAVVSVLIGYGVARFVAWAFPRGYVPEYLKAPVLLVAVIGTFVLSNAVQQETGLLAVTVMGLALANMHVIGLRTIRPFKENITVLLLSGVFVLLSASLNVKVLQQFEWRFLAFLLVLLFVVRPLTVAVSLAFSEVPWRERVLIGWIAPRGVVAIAVSGLFAFRLTELGYGDGGILVSLSFGVVIATIIAHGFSIRPVARRLKLISEKQGGLLLVGSSPWSLALAAQLKESEIPVTVCDTSWERLKPARAAGVPFVHGEVLAEIHDGHIDLADFQAVAATTDNEAYNTLVCAELATELGHDSVYQLGDSGERRGLPQSLRGRSLFEQPMSAEELLERERQGWIFRRTRLTEKFGFADMCATLPEGGSPLLVIRKNGNLLFFGHESRPKPEAGDIVISFVPPVEKEKEGGKL